VIAHLDGLAGDSHHGSVRAEALIVCVRGIAD
jgi:hypothetical protein